MSRYPRDAIAAIHRYITGIPHNETVRVYAAGGDGILFDCLNGIIDFPNAELTMIPYGSTNDFIRVFGEGSREGFRDIKKLISAPARPVDVIDCGSNYALNDITFGLESQSLINANKIFRHPRLKWIRKYKSLAPFVYKFGGMASVLNDDEIFTQEYNVLADGEDLSGVYFDISIANGACIGGTMVPSPYAKPDDGLLDVILTAGGTMLTAAGIIASFTKGHFEKNPLSFHRQVKKFEIKSEIPMRVQMDGESFYTDEMELEVMPGKIKFAAPEGLEIVDYSYRAYKPKK
jgi:diacylglycerol kinase family enzyme